MDYLKVGQTPLILMEFEDKRIWGKGEFLNPSGSIKDRPIENILNSAQKEGLIKRGDTLVEATSGNAGISLAMFAAQRGYKCVIVMPSNMSQERKDILKYYGSQLIEVGAGDFDGAIKLRDELSQKEGWFNVNQFHSPWNLQAHRDGTGPEIIYQCQNKCIKPSCFVAGTGTGGTMMGAGPVLRDYFDLKLIAVEPSESPVMSGGSPGLHGIQGIGDGSKFLVELDQIDKIITISTDEAKRTSLELSSKFGLFVGISAGANVLASLRALEILGTNDAITILCDRGDRYLSCF
jgi:cysteine synthase A